MIKVNELRPEFSQFIPPDLEPGILYISMQYATASHLCCCGCGEEVVTPFTPTDWSMSFDGESVSLSPSIGNWYLHCRSHYFIRRGKVIEAGSWSKERIDAEWDRDRKAKSQFYQDKEAVQPAEESPIEPQVLVEPHLATQRGDGILRRLRNWFRKLSD